MYLPALQAERRNEMALNNNKMKDIAREVGSKHTRPTALCCECEGIAAS